MTTCPEQQSELRAALKALMKVYSTSDIETIFVKAYREVIGGHIDNALVDHRLYCEGQATFVPPYIERACRDHGVWPSRKT